MSSLPASLLLTSFMSAAALVGDETADRLKELRAAYKAKDAATAVRLYDQLVQSFELLAPKDQDEVVKTVELAFTTRRDEGSDVDQLFVGAAASLANMGPLGGKALVRALAVKHLRSRPMVLATLVEGLGRQIDPAMVDAILPWLKPEKALGVNAPVVVGAANALARYREAEPKLRKRAVGELVAVYADLDLRYETEHAKAEPDVALETAFQQIEKPLLDSLRALSGEQFESAADWTQWWATAKSADWSAAVGSAAPAKKKEDGS